MLNYKGKEAAKALKKLKKKLKRNYHETKLWSLRLKPLLDKLIGLVKGMFTTRYNTIINVQVQSQ
jgi:hypothetical protein